jgi:histidinol phosphatase-like enzyme (inositol monophosphatase family)
MTDLLDVALAAAREAGDAALRRFRDLPPVERKPDGSVVTEADREAEAILRRAIRRAFPSHRILGEEGGEEGAGAAGVRWIVDPIDGTESFVRGVPLWGVLVAAEADGVPAVGVCHMPALGETVAAARGRGCTWNGRPARVSRVGRLEDACALMTSSRAVRRRTSSLPDLEERVSRVRGWSDCYAYVLVATGRADLAFDPVLRPWDTAAFLPILEEAGGRFTDWRGRPTAHGGDGFASNGLLHDEALALLTRGETRDGTPRTSS